MAMGMVIRPSMMKSQRHPLMPLAPFKELWIAVCKNPPNIVPARPEEVKIPLRFPSSRAVYQEPRI